MQTNEIKISADKIWQMLSGKEHMSIDEVVELDSSSFVVYLALGWLAKENKIYFSPSNDGLNVCVTQNIPEIYY